VSQSNARFNASDTLIVTVYSVTITIEFEKDAIKQKGRPLATMLHLKSSIVEVRAEVNCLAHALVIAIARLNNDPNYKAYRQGLKIRPVVHQINRDDRYRCEERCGDPRTNQISGAFSGIKDRGVFGIELR